MPSGIPRTQDERVARHKLIYGNEPPLNRRTNYQVETITDSEKNNLIMLTGGVAALYIFVEFILPRIWIK